MVDDIGKNNAGDTPEAAAPLDCEHWEALLADKMDGALAPGDEGRFAAHGRVCPGCKDLLEQAEQGQQWLKLLEENTPAAPVDLLARILTKTQGAGREVDFPVGTGAPAGLSGLSGHVSRWNLPFLPSPSVGLAAARGAHNARMLMTAAMAFFSVALTLSVAGVRLNSVHAAELRPQSVQANVSRSFYGTKKQVVSFYENLRLVYEVESKMHDIRRETPEPPLPRQQSAPPLRNGTPGSAPGSPKAHAPSAGHAATGDGPALQKNGGKHPEQVEQVLRGWPLSVDYVQTKSPEHLRKLKSPASAANTSTVSSNMLSGATSKERIRI